MFIQSKIAIKIIYLVIGLHVALAWLPPERCKQGEKTERLYSTVLNSFTESVPTVGNITEMAINQNINLNETYAHSKFFGVPISGSFYGCNGCSYEIYVPNQCTFYTYSPSLLSSVYCQEGVACKLGRTVSTVDTYTASEGYNWGVKISTKMSFLAKTFEVGGEVSTGGSYSCTYTKSKTKTDNVECSVSSGGGKTLRLYNVQSDMECQFSTVTMVPETRNGKAMAWAPYDYFTDAERKITEDHALIRSVNSLVLPNLDRMSDHLLEKMKNIFPDYNPYTDIVALWRSPSQPSVRYYKVGSTISGIKKVIPFTNEAGDSVYQYACILT